MLMAAFSKLVSVTMIMRLVTVTREA